MNKIGLRVLCVLGTCAAVVAAASVARADSPVVKTKQGSVRGKLINNGQVAAFLGIPYAAPPVGDLRWRPPQPAARWRGTRDGRRFGAHCYQTHQFADMVFQDSGPSEDCLFLNVYAPANATAKSKLPVMFWIHGVGYQGGSASEPRHDGDFLPTRGVVLVTINYRLGVFGFLATPALAREGNGAAGNYGLMDQVAALQWVNSNIAAFGGDPQNVTIFGESAGSYSVSLLMASQSARGLFAKAIGESGGELDIGGPQHPGFEQVEQQDEAWVKSLGMNLTHLRELPPDIIVAAAQRSDAPRFWPTVDGSFLTEPVAVTYAAGQQAHVPLLAGWNRDEMSGLAKGMTAAKWKQYAQQHFGDKAQEFLKYYPADNDAQAIRSAIDFNSDAFIAFSTWRWVQAQVKTGQSPVYRYHFMLPAPPSKFHPGSSAFHSDDIEYVFGTLDTRPGAVWRPEDRQLSSQIMTYWTNFARSGNPNGAGVPQWPRFDRTDQVLNLGNPTVVVPDTAKPRYEFLMRLWNIEP